RFRLGAGAVFALYIPLYTAGRFAVELMRTDFANTILGLRVNTWTSGLLFLAGTALFLALARRNPPSTVPATSPSHTTPSQEKP
ncbi:MAG TPA: prolipoprotein diacylglyceryl transferase family protein, partial [Deinococcales bacterium]|nr:prolipoprotein diacylglyceryl transferase family protein [Deinococcales bacterium]